MREQGTASLTEAVEKKRVLIVEDDPDTGLMLIYALEQDTLLFPLLAHSSTEAFRLAKTYQLDLLLLDYYLEGMDGLELADQLHRISGLEAIPTIVMSAAMLSLEREQQISDRQLVFLRKPFDLDELFDTIDALLTEQQMA